ncbi:hypothetical protein [Campylobacter troglodytis]|uniref:hypothetical protein n=1 Tax=Campylobacter troglodytis TaxID=654363 RepID=UPI001159C5C9|nr:hypothetical protein [Campylobacter troglodytis]
MIELWIFWVVFILLPLLFFIFKAKWRFFATVLPCVNLCLCAMSDLSLVFNENLWGLLQTELTVSKSVFFIYESVLLCIYLILLFIAYKYIKIRVIIFIYFLLCNLLLPFSIVEKVLFRS